MPLKWMPWILLALSRSVSAGELHDAARGLEVRVEDLPGSTSFNGLPLRISRAAGPGIGMLARRIIDDWRAESGPESVRVEDCCGWRIASRIRSARPEVIQWRGEGPASELIWSESEPESARVPPESGTLPRMPQCRWSTRVSGRVGGRQFAQVAADCGLPAGDLLDAIGRHLDRGGWHRQTLVSRVIRAERQHAQLQVVIVERDRPSAGVPASSSSLVAIESWPEEGATP